ncbi:homoserine O-succinyltransferase [Clostridium felsineum]|nr:homoserine O-succinyltransferase [Clostridium felsineum]
MKILAESDKPETYIVASENGKNIFVIRHAEYDSDTFWLNYYVY